MKRLPIARLKGEAKAENLQIFIFFNGKWQVKRKRADARADLGIFEDQSRGL